MGAGPALAYKSSVCCLLARASIMQRHLILGGLQANLLLPLKVWCSQNSSKMRKSDRSCHAASHARSVEGLHLLQHGRATPPVCLPLPT